MEIKLISLINSKQYFINSCDPSRDTCSPDFACDPWGYCTPDVGCDPDK